MLKALFILLVGWVVAKGVAAGAKKALDKTDVDNRLANYVTGDEQQARRSRRA